MTMKKTSCLAVAVLAVSCMPIRTPPQLTPPPTGYIEIDLPSDVVWTSAVDIFLDMGVEWDVLEPDLGILKFRRLLSDPGPRAPSYADCGTLDGVEASGPTAVYAEMSIRVLEGQEGGALVKVVAPQVWTTTFQDIRLSCISTGLAERETLDAIEGYATAYAGGAPVITRAEISASVPPQPVKCEGEPSATLRADESQWDVVFYNPTTCERLTCDIEARKASTERQAIRACTAELSRNQGRQ